MVFEVIVPCTPNDLFSYCSRLWYGQYSLTSLLYVPEVAEKDKNMDVNVEKTVSTKSNNNQQQELAGEHR